MNKKRVLKYLSYKILSDNEFDIHSPFLFDFAENVLYEKTPYYPFQLIETVRAKLLRDSTVLTIEDFGAGSKVFKSNERKVSDICRHSVKPAKYGQLLFRMVNYFKPAISLELGTSLGITTSYLGRARESSQVISIEGDTAISSLAKSTLELTRTKNAKIYTGTFKETLPQVLSEIPKLDFLFIDGHHDGKSTIAYFKQCINSLHDQSIVVFDDINWSDDMLDAWNQIKEMEEVRVSIDLFQMGIVFFHKHLTRQHYTLKF